MTWNLDPTIVVGIATLGAAYVAVAAMQRTASRMQAASFMAGLLALFLALASPLDTLGDQYLLSMHMVQHLILVLVVPPLLLYGTPRSMLEPVLTLPLVGPVARLLTRGPVAFAIYNVVFSLAHLPTMFDLTLSDEGVHVAEHLLFIATGVIAWWPVLSPVPGVPRLPYPYRMLYLFLQTLPCSLVGALITLSGAVLYAPYAAMPRLWGLTPLADQQIAGLAMWIGGSVYYFLAFMVVFFFWAASEERGGRPRLVVIKGSVEADGTHR